jgi:hypothetical protein
MSCTKNRRMPTLRRQFRGECLSRRLQGIDPVCSRMLTSLWAAVGGLQGDNERVTHGSVLWSILTITVIHREIYSLR